jgi:hypothetical protein
MDKRLGTSISVALLLHNLPNNEMVDEGLGNKAVSKYMRQSDFQFRSTLLLTGYSKKRLKKKLGALASSKY